MIRKIIKWIVRGIGVFILVMGILGVITFINRPGEIPDTKEAPYGFQTYSQDDMLIPSRVYYSKTVEIVDNKPIIGPGYWDFDGEGYNYHKGTKELPENTKIVKRSNE